MMAREPNFVRARWACLRSWESWEPEPTIVSGRLAIAAASMARSTRL